MDPDKFTHVAVEKPAQVLLIEDDPEQGILVKRWLEADRGFDVTHVDDGNIAARAVVQPHWDLVISDIELPGMSGLEVLKISKTRNPLTPTLLITAHESVDYAVTALRNRADDFIVKPLDRSRFVAKAVELIDRSRAEKRARQTNVLAIGAHPDDVEIGCGGILLRHSAGGDRVSVLTLTGGEIGGAKSDRIVESERAAEMLGAQLLWGHLQDASVSEGRETITVIENAIRATGATTIYTHSINDAHQDHRNAHRATIVAAREVPEIYCYQAPSCTIDFRPSVFVEIGPFVDGKLEVIRQYGSQVGQRPYLAESLIRATSRYWGRFAGYKDVEPLEAIRRSE